MARVSSLRRLVLAVVLLGIWIVALNWLFTRYSGQSYFAWYVGNGAMISAATAFLSLIWGKLESEQKDLLAWNPLMFLGTCRVLVGIFYQLLGTSLNTRLAPIDYADDGLSIFEHLWDGIFSIFTVLLAVLAVLAWLLVVAPLFYVLTLFTGALARREMHRGGQRIVYQRGGSQGSVRAIPLSEPLPPGAIDISLGGQAFALTNAINALVLFLAKRLLEHYH